MHPDFNPPGQPKLTTRKSTLTGLFFTTLTPFVEPSDDDVRQALKVLGMSEGKCVCAYCGDAKSEWDHFRPIVEKRKPTGYITEIANLVPSCGKCNQSRGNKHWKAWMLSSARLSPKTRNVPDIDERVSRLNAYENWRVPVNLKYGEIVGRDEWDKHIRFLDEVLALLAQAEINAVRLRSLAEAKLEQGDS